MSRPLRMPNGPIVHRLRALFRSDQQQIARRGGVRGMTSTQRATQLFTHHEPARQLWLDIAGRCEPGQAIELEVDPGIGRFRPHQVDQLQSGHAGQFSLTRLPQLSHDFDDFSSFDSRSSLISLSPIFVTPL